MAKEIIKKGWHKIDCPQCGKKGIIRPLSRVTCGGKCSRDYAYATRDIWRTARIEKKVRAELKEKLKKKNSKIVVTQNMILVYRLGINEGKKLERKKQIKK